MFGNSLQRFAQFATGRIRCGGHDKAMILGAPDLGFPVNASLGLRLACDLNIGASNFLVIGASDLGFPAKVTLAGDTSKELDKNVVVRVILHAQCSLQRKEAKWN